MKRENILHVRLVNLFLLVVCHYIYVTKILVVDNWLYTAMKPTRMKGDVSQNASVSAATKSFFATDMYCVALQYTNSVIDIS